MRRLPLVALTLLTLAAVPSGASAALQGDQEIAALNGQRSMNGIPGDLTENVDWSLGCAKHMAWVQQNGLAHDEAEGTPGYSVEGDIAGNSSVLTSYGSSFTADGTNTFQHAPIHLMQMLNPVMRATGAADGCLATLRDTDRTFPAITNFSYPGSGGVALTKETAFEGPFVPGDFVGLPMGTETGPHIFFYAFLPGANANGTSKGKITSASLTGPGGAVAIKTVDNATTGALGNLGQYLSPGGILIPVAPLTNGATYTASVNFAFNRGGTTSKTWSFTAKNTLPLPTVPAPSRPPLGFVPTPDQSTKPTPSPVPAVPTPVVPAATPAPVVAPALAPAPAPVATPTPTPAPAPITLTNLKLKKRSLALTASRQAALWLTVERKTVKGKGKKKRLTYTLRQALAVATKAGGTTSVALKALPKGEYRVTFRLNAATGAIQLQTTLRAK